MIAALFFRATGEMPVEAVVRDVGLSADEPFGERHVPFQHLVPRLKPVQFRRDFRPETFGIFRGALEIAS